MKENINDEQKVFLLDDNLLDFSSHEDLLGNSIYVDELQYIIMSSSNNNNTETIALIGNWGSGKSSVVKSLETRIKKEKINGRDVRFIWYNAWKFNNDSFRKTFLIHSTDNPKEKERLENFLYEKTIRTDYEVDKKVVKIVFLLCILFASLLFFFLVVSKDYKNIEEMIMETTTKIIGIGVIQYISSIVLKKIIVEKKVSIEKEFSPNDFSEEYEKVSKENKCFSVFVIDDLDRCDSNQTLEILDTVKGYLKTNNDNNVFIIPIDKNRLKKILNKQRGYDEQDTNEYFTKIFDVSIKIKDPGNLNLFDMVQSYSNQYNYELTNYSISLLCDFLIKTPRDVKKHLNIVRIKLDILKKQKQCLFIDSKAFSDDDFNDFIKIYIIENRWSQYYDWLVKNFDVHDLYNKANLLKSIPIKDDELVYFLTTSQDVSLKHFFAYHNLKDDGINFNKQVIFEILNNDVNKALEIINQKNLDLVPNIEYAYKVYVKQRGLAYHYLPQILNCYFYILNRNDESSKLLEEGNMRITDIKFSMEYVFQQIKDHGHGTDKIECFIDTMIKYATSSNVITGFSVLYNLVVKFLTEIELIERVTDSVQNPIIFINGILNKETYANALITLVGNTKKTEISFNGMMNIHTLKLLEKEKYEILKIALENKCFAYIYEVVKIEPEDNGLYIVDILEAMDVIEKLNTSYNHFVFESIKQDLFELKVLNKLFTVFPEDIWNFIEDKITLSYIKRIVDTIDNLKDEINISLLNELSIFYYHIAIAKDDIEPFKIFYDSLNIANHEIIIKSMLNMEINSKMINELYIKRLNTPTDLSLLNEYIMFLENKKNIEFIRYWLKLQKEKTNLSINLETIQTSLTLYYKNYLDNILPSFLTLDQKYIEEIYANLDIDVITSPEVIEFLRTLKKDNPILIETIKRVQTGENYKELLHIVKKYGKAISAYHIAMKNIVDNVKSVDELIDLHNDKSIKMDSVELNIIKKKVEDDYPNQKEKFPSISWKY